MRTMKKVLALTLALAMMFSVAAFGFNDDEKILANLTDDVRLLVAVNILQGDQNGNFNPELTITRGEAAKMIYVFRNKGVDDKAAGWQVNTAGKFTDVALTDWHNGYVNYCASMNIIAGYPDGTFRPNQPITGVELMKMLLTAIGFKADVQGYTGADWVNNVTSDAQACGLLDDYSISYTVECPRQWAAKLFTNAFKVFVPVYLGNEIVGGGPLGNVGVFDGLDTAGHKYLGLRTTTGTIVETNTVRLGTKIKSKNSNSAIVSNEFKGDMWADTNNGREIFEYDVPVEYLGQEVSVVFKDNANTGVVDALDQNDLVYDVYLTGKSKVYETTLDELVLEDDERGSVHISSEGYTGKDYNAEALAKINFFMPTRFSNANYTGYARVNDIVPQASTAPPVTAFNWYSEFAVHAANDLKATFPVKMIDTNGNGTLNYIFVEPSVYAQVDRVNERNYRFVAKADNEFNDVFDPSRMWDFDYDEILAFNSKSDFNKLDFSDSVEKDDVVKVTWTYDQGKEVIKVEKLTPINTTITRYSDNKVRVDGEDIERGTMYLHGNKIEGFGLNKEYSVYMDGKYVVGITGVKASSMPANIAYIIGFSHMEELDDYGNSYTPKRFVPVVRLMFKDGTKANYEYKQYGLNATNVPDGYLTIPTGVDDGAGGTFGQWLVGGTGPANTNGASKQYNIYHYVLSDEKVYVKPIVVNGITEGAVPASAWKHSSAAIGGSMFNDDSFLFMRHLNSSNEETFSVIKAKDLEDDMTIVNTWSGNMFSFEGDGNMSTLLCAAVGINAKLPEATKTQYVYLKNTGEENGGVFKGENSKGEEVLFAYAIDQDGKEVELQIDNGGFNESWLGKFYKVETKSGVSTLSSIANGYENNATETTGFFKAAITGSNATHISFKDSASNHIDDAFGSTGATNFTFAYDSDDIKIWYVDVSPTNRVTLKEDSGIPTADHDDVANDYHYNCYFKLNNDRDKVVEMIVEWDGETIAPAIG